MHDPMTVAFEIKFPWGKRTEWGYFREPFITIWHVDPKSDGSDDSCGYSSPRLGKEAVDLLKFDARSEARDPWFLAKMGKGITSPSDAEALMRGVIYTVCNRLKVKYSADDERRWVTELIHKGFDNFRTSLAFLPGYHSNRENDNEEDREYQAHRLLIFVGRYIMRQRRKWWQHPKWHLHHWRIQIHPLQKLKRVLFDRCCNCGKGFGWNYCPMSDWNGTKMWHADCERPTVTQLQTKT